MHRSLVIASAAFLFCSLLLPSTDAEAGVPARSGIVVWATGHPAAAVLPLSKNDWTNILPETTADAFKGDAVLSNGRIAAVLRQKDAAVEVHAVKPDGAIARVQLRLHSAAGEPAISVARLALIENAKAGATIQAT